MFVNGLATGGRVITGYTYFCELYPDRAGTIVGTCWNCLEATVNILLAVYYAYVSKDWRWVILYAVCSGTLALIIGVFFLPESPKWLYEKERFVQCAKSLAYMGKINGVQDMHTINALMSSEQVKDQNKAL